MYIIRIIRLGKNSQYFTNFIMDMKLNSYDIITSFSAVDCGCHNDALLQLNTMKNKLDVIEKMFRVGSGVLVVDSTLSEWLKLTLVE